MVTLQRLPRIGSNHRILRSALTLSLGAKKAAVKYCEHSPHEAVDRVAWLAGEADTTAEFVDDRQHAPRSRGTDAVMASHVVWLLNEFWESHGWLTFPTEDTIDSLSEGHAAEMVDNLRARVKLWRHLADAKPRAAGDPYIDALERARCMAADVLAHTASGWLLEGLYPLPIPE